MIKEVFVSGNFIAILHCYMIIKTSFFFSLRNEIYVRIEYSLSVLYVFQGERYISRAIL